MGLVSDASGFFEKMTLENNLLFYAKILWCQFERSRGYSTKVGLLDSKRQLKNYLQV